MIGRKETKKTGAGYEVKQLGVEQGARLQSSVM